MKRRRFMQIIPGSALLLGGAPYIYSEANVLPISANGYNWNTFYRRSGKAWGKDWDVCMAEFAQTGIQGFEPSIPNPDHLRTLLPFLNTYGIQLPSIYVGTELHDPATAAESMNTILSIAELAGKAGTKIIVTNPNPIQWGSDLLKNDEQLLCQSRHLDQLGEAVRKLGIKLAYHTHDVELKAGAREFHHVMQNTAPENLHFCMDVHWIYRGSGNSQVAVFDTLKMYGNRIASLHLRQSEGGVWTESFHPKGDIDYARFAKILKQMGIFPHLVIEQCLEEKSPNTMDVVQAHQVSLKEIESLFKPISG